MVQLPDLLLLKSLKLQQIESTAETTISSFSNTVSKASRLDEATSNVATSTKATEGSFSISNWTGYPEGGVKPQGPFRIIEGAEYKQARGAANKANKALHNSNPSKYSGKQIHENHPIKFGGDPTSVSKKTPLTPLEYAKYTTFWNQLLRDIKQ